ncbi:hypothetical protein N7468_000022 [Penicillium chermesinum]|uniref:LysM domain-containing protein n=1 Tax=Penicillium chermesinum TaxID=63820 RepID=A0A9W9U020_9EURO|nr:uncharacterized protein N7468_000022 [Penicillium chermesinum]KAJ5248571.1 hypothetical protein N7468_000022 [Penicillium chermesinum]
MQHGMTLPHNVVYKRAAVNTEIPTRTSHPGYVYTEPAQLPTAPGTISGCYKYQNADEYTNLCRDLAYDNSITVADLAEWNPSLNNTFNCTLDQKYSYCALKFENSTYYTCNELVADNGITLTELLAWNTWLSEDCDTALLANLTIFDDRAVCIGVGEENSTTATATTSAATGTTIQASTSMGSTPTDTISGCQEFYTVTDSDDCASVLSKFGITVSQFYQWNPSVGSTCTNLWREEAYCVKGPATATSSGPNAPVQTGIASNCKKYYTVASGDSCAKIESTYGITFAQLYKWNPAIGSNCQTLDVGYSVCVGVSF